MKKRSFASLLCHYENSNCTTQQQHHQPPPLKVQRVVENLQDKYHSHQSSSNAKIRSEPKVPFVVGRETFEHRVHEKGVLFNILSFLPVRDHVIVRAASKKWKTLVENLDIDTLDASSSSVPPRVFSDSITSIMKCYKSVKTVNVSSQCLMRDRTFLTLVSRYWITLVNVIANDCQLVTDHALHAILDSTSLTLSSIHMNKCKSIAGDFNTLECVGSLPSFCTISLRDTCVEFDFVSNIDTKFTTLSTVDAMHTPAHHVSFVNRHWTDLLVSLASVASANVDRPHVFMSILQDYKDRIVSSKDSAANAFTKTLYSNPLQSLVNVPLDEEDMSTALSIAAEEGNHFTIQMLLNTGKADGYVIDNDGATPLFIACRVGNALAASTLLRMLHHEKEELRTSFLVACEMGHADIVSLLLLNTSSISSIKNGLYAAVKNKRNTVVQVLLEKYGINDDSAAAAVVITTAMFLACERGFNDIVKSLLQFTKVGETLPAGVTALYVACQSGHANVAKTLLDSGANPNYKRLGVPVIYIAAQEGHAGVVSLLLSYGADVHGNIMADFATALHIAARMGNISVLKTLVLTGNADINVKTRCGLTPLFIACQEGHDEVVDFLLSQESLDLNASIVDGATALFVASQHGHVSIVASLLTAFADPNAAKTNGATALHVAVQVGNFHVVQLLLAAGANVDAVTNTGGSALHLATTFGHAEIRDTILRHWMLVVSQQHKLAVSSTQPARRSSSIVTVR